MKKLWIIAAVAVAALALGACSSTHVFTANPSVVKSKTPSVEQETLPPGQVQASTEALETGKRKWRVGDRKNAIKAFHRALDKNPYNFEAHYWLGVIDRDQHNWDEAGGHFTWAVKYCPQGRWEARIRSDWGKMYELQGQPGLAGKQYDMALLADPEYREAKYGHDRVLPLPNASRGNHGKGRGHDKGDENND